MHNKNKGKQQKGKNKEVRRICKFLQLSLTHKHTRTHTQSNMKLYKEVEAEIKIKRAKNTNTCQNIGLIMNLGMSRQAGWEISISYKRYWIYNAVSTLRWWDWSRTRPNGPITGLIKLEREFTFPFTRFKPVYRWILPALCNKEIL